MEQDPTLPPPTMPDRSGRFWTLGSLGTITGLVLLGGTGAAEDVYVLLGRYNLVVVVAIAGVVVWRSLRRGRGRDRTVAP